MKSLQDIINLMFIVLTIREYFPRWFEKCLFWFNIGILFASAFFAGQFIRYNNLKLADSSLAVVIVSSALVSITKFMVLFQFRFEILDKMDELLTVRDKFSEMTIKLVKLFILLIFLFYIIWNMVPFFQGGKNLPSPYYIPLANSSQTIYILSYTFSCSALSIYCFTQASGDAVYMLLASNLIVKTSKLLNIIKKHKIIVEDTGKDDEIVKSFVSIHNLHNECLKDFDFTGKIMDPVFLIQVLQSITLSCFMAFTFTKAEETADIIKSVGCLVLGFYQQFIICFFGQKITDKTMEQSLSFYMFLRTVANRENNN